MSLLHTFLYLDLEQREIAPGSFTATQRLGPSEDWAWVGRRSILMFRGCGPHLVHGTMSVGDPGSSEPQGRGTMELWKDASTGTRGPDAATA